MGAAAALFGTLGALGNFGEQRAEATQAAHDEIQKRLRESEEEQAFQTQQREANFRYNLETQPQPVGSPVTGPDGFQYQRYQNPLTRAWSVQKLPGPAAETQAQQDIRTLRSTGLFSEDDIKEMVKATYIKPSTAERTGGWLDDPEHPGQQKREVTDIYGNLIFYQYRTKPPTDQPTYETRTGKDIYGNDITSTSVRWRGQQPGAPQPRFQAPYVPFMPRPGAAAPGAAAAALDFPPGQTSAQPASRPAQVTTQPAGAPPLVNGQIPPQPGVNENVRNLANQVIANPATPVPAAAEGPVYGLIQKYYPGWIGKLPPASIQAILKIDPVIKQVDRLTDDIKRLKLTNNNTPLYLAKERAKYAVGMASEEGSLGADIANLSLGSLVEAASALAGSSRAMAALTIAQEHTPKAWIDSPKLIYEKLLNIRQRLVDMEDVARNPYGTLTPTTPKKTDEMTPEEFLLQLTKPVGP